MAAWSSGFDRGRGFFRELGDRALFLDRTVALMVVVVAAASEDVKVAVAVVVVVVVLVVFDTSVDWFSMFDDDSARIFLRFELEFGPDLIRMHFVAAGPEEAFTATAAEAAPLSIFAKSAVVKGELDGDFGSESNSYGSFSVIIVKL